MALKPFLSAAVCSAVVLGDLVGIPTVPFTATGNGSYDALKTRSVIVDRRCVNATDTHGWTLIPPTLGDFASTFANDLASFADLGCEVEIGSAPQASSIFLTLDNRTEYQDAAGRWTSEGYTLDVHADHVIIAGASPLGAWWGTRSLLQQAVLNNGSFKVGQGVDSPGWNTRGIFVRLTSLPAGYS